MVPAVLPAWLATGSEDVAALKCLEDVKYSSFSGGAEAEAASSLRR
jgi:hypothetical protein